MNLFLLSGFDFILLFVRELTMDLVLVWSYLVLLKFCEPVLTHLIKGMELFILISFRAASWVGSNLNPTDPYPIFGQVGLRQFRLWLGLS